MQFFIAIIPPKGIKQQIEDIQKKFGDNCVEPHITVKAQGGLSDDKLWIGKVKKGIAGFRPFKVVLGRAKTFENKVLYISVKSEEIVRLHNEIVSAINPPGYLKKEHFEDKFYTPHLTLGMLDTGFQRSDFPEMAKLADALFAEEKVHFTAEFIRLFSIQDGKCQELEDIYFEK